MKYLRKLLRQLNLLNIILTAVVLAFANYSVLPLLNMKIDYTLPSAKKGDAVKEEESAPTKTPSPFDYMVIAENNLFHPERKIPLAKKEEMPLPKPEIVLYGTTITDNVSLAYVEDKKSPRSTAGRGKRLTVLKKGDTLSGFVLKEIKPDSIVMLRGEEKLVVNLNDPQNQKTRDGMAAGQPLQPQPQPVKPVAIQPRQTQSQPQSQPRQPQPVKIFPARP